MASDRVTPGLLDRASASSELGAEWRRLTRSATAVAIITSPVPFVWFHSGQGWGIVKSLVATFLVVIAFRGLVDLMTRRLLPWPSLYGTDDTDLKEEDVVNRRRASFWRYWLRFFVFFAGVLTVVWLLRLAVPGGTTNWIDSSAQKLANFVAPRYISGGSPIAVVQAQPLFFHDQVVDGVAFTRAPFQDVGEHYHQLEPAGQSTMAYVFCGQAARCGLAATGAEDVIPLLRRESLELALYTFKYWPEIDAVVAILPPATKSSPAVYLRRRNLEAELSKPLEQTLPSHEVITASSMTAAEVATVERLTRIFPSSFQETASGRMLLLLGTGSQ